MPAYDRAPIDQTWAADYCREFLKVAKDPRTDPVMRELIMLRVQYVTDLIEAWQVRRWSLADRDKEKTKT